MRVAGPVGRIVSGATDSARGSMHPYPPNDTRDSRCLLGTTGPDCTRRNDRDSRVRHHTGRARGDQRLRALQNDRRRDRRALRIPALLRGGRKLPWIPCHPATARCDRLPAEQDTRNDSASLGQVSGPRRPLARASEEGCLEKRHTGRMVASTPPDLADDLIRLAVLVGQFSRRELDSNGNPHMAMLVIAVHAPVSPTRLARCLHMSSPGITALVDRLEVAGFVVRSADSTDRRRAVITLSDRGRERIHEMTTALQSTLPPLSHEDALGVQAYLRSTVAALDARA